MNDGFTSIPHGIVEQLFRIDCSLTRYEIAALLFIARKTYGWHKTTERIPYSQFTEFTGIHRGHIWRTLRSLIERKIVIRTGDHQNAYYRINEAVNEWKLTPPQVSVIKQAGDTSTGVSKKRQTDTSSGVGVTPLQVSELTPLQVSSKETKETYKKKTPKSSIRGECLDLSLLFHQKQKSDGLHHQDFKQKISEKTPVVVNGADTLEKLHRIEGESLKDIKTVLRFILKDSGNGTWTGWKSQVISLASLRTKGKSGTYKYFTVKNAMEKQKASKQPEPEAVTPSGHYGESGIWISDK
ncbi:MAG: replication protein [Candidatus Marinimicrobia bacterium]|nr:replication protein [Candidatus Neomarinimicrobiota bacterium]